MSQALPMKLRLPEGRGATGHVSADTVQASPLRAEPLEPGPARARVRHGPEQRDAAESEAVRPESSEVGRALRGLCGSPGAGRGLYIFCASLTGGSEV